MSNPLSIPFTDYIANDIRKGNYGIAEQLLGDDIIINGERIGNKGLEKMFGKPKKQPNDWSMGLKSWWFGLCPRAWVCRGKDNFYLTLTKRESIALAHVIKAIFDEQRDANRRAKQQQKIAQQQAYFLDGYAQQRLKNIATSND